MNLQIKVNGKVIEQNSLQMAVLHLRKMVFTNSDIVKIEVTDLDKVKKKVVNKKKDDADQ